MGDEEAVRVITDRVAREHKGLTVGRSMIIERIADFNPRANSAKVGKSRLRQPARTALYGRPSLEQGRSSSAAPVPEQDEERAIALREAQTLVIAARALSE